MARNTAAYKTKGPDEVDQWHWSTFESGIDAGASPSISVLEETPDTYAEYFALVAKRLFCAPKEKSLAFLHRYIEGRGSLLGIVSALQKHSYLQEDIAKSDPDAPDRIEEALVQLRDIKRENLSHTLSLDDVVETSYLLPDEFDRRATVVLAYELWNFSIPKPRLLEDILSNVTQRFYSCTRAELAEREQKRFEEGKPSVAHILQWMEFAVAEKMPVADFIEKMHFSLVTAPERYATAVHQLTKKNYKTARTSLQELTRDTAASLCNIKGPLAYQLAQIALQTKNMEKAEQLLQHAIMMHSDAFPSSYDVKQEDAYRDLIVLYQKQNKIASALLTLKNLSHYYTAENELFIEHRKYIEAHAFTQGKAAFTAGDLESAANCFGLEILVNPKNSWALYYLGRAQHKQKKADHAHAAFDSAVALRPAFATQDYEEALAQIAKSDYTKALWAIERAGEIAHYSDKAPRQKITDTANKIGIAFKDGTAGNKDYTAAKRAFDAALATDADNVDAHYHLGTIAFMQKDYGAAEQAFLRSVSLKPKHAWAFYQLGRTYDARKQAREAQKAYASAAALGHAEAKKLLKK